MDLAFAGTYDAALTERDFIWKYAHDEPFVASIEGATHRPSGGGQGWSSMIASSGGQRFPMGWGNYKRMFGGGNGVFYAVGPNNVLYWFRHPKDFWLEGVEKLWMERENLICASSL